MKQQSRKSREELADRENTQKNQMLSIKVEQEQQKLTAYNQKIVQLEEQCQKLRQEKLTKQKHLQNIIKETQQLKIKDNAIVLHLRQYFKALKEDLEAQESQDLIDVDNMSYEQLLELGQTIGKVSKGLPAQKLNSLQKVVWNSSLAHECAICRDDFESGTECVELSCKHLFHQSCLGNWLKIEKICPLCKAEI